MTIVIDPTVFLALRLALAMLFAAALWHKLGDLRTFRARVLAYGVVPRALAGPTIALVLLCEAFVAGAMLLPGKFRLGAVVALVLLAVYSAAIAANLVRGRRDLDCGCLGRAGTGGLRAVLLVRNVVLASVPAVLLLPASGRALAWPDAIGVGGTVATLVVLAMATDVLVSNWPAHAVLRDRLRRSG